MSGWDVASGLLVLAGALFCVVGAFGMLRLPDVPSRLQAATKPQSLGLLLILVGVALRLEPPDAAALVLVALLQMMTAPVLSQMAGRAAYRTGGMECDTVEVDELAERVAGENLREDGG